MIDFGMDSKLYKFSKFIYEMLKINLMIITVSFTIIGFGAAISSGFYELNQVYRKKAESNFGRFILNFRANFRKSLYFTAPIIFSFYIFWRKYWFIILDKRLYLYIFSFWALLLFSYMFALLIITGLMNMSIKNTMVYGLILITNKFFLLLLASFILFYLLKLLLLNFPIILLFFNIIIPLLFFYFIYEKLINNKEFLTTQS